MSVRRRPTGATKGSVARKRLDALADDMRQLRENGTLPRITARQIEAWGEAEYEARTWNGWGRTVCHTCQTAMSDNGACMCPEWEDGGRTAEDALLASLGLASRKPRGATS
jgi:hypothetical protein